MRGEATFGKLMGVLITLLLKIPIPTLVPDAHPAAHIVAPGIHHVFHLRLSGEKLAEGKLTES